jgi:general secretion pathway protein D
MRRHRLRAVLVVALAASSFSCAARSYFRQGQSEARKGNWDMAVARLTMALQKDPSNIDYKIALENAKVQASRFHYDEGVKALAADDLDKSQEELEIATKYDVANKSALDELHIVQGKIQKKEETTRRLQDYDAMKARVDQRPLAVPMLSPRNPVPVNFHFSDQPLLTVLDTLSKLSGVNILFDPAMKEKDKRVTIAMSSVTFEQALDEICLLNQLFYKVIDSNTILVAPDSAVSRRHYDESVVRTFYLQNADLTEMATLIPKLVTSQSLKIATNPSLQALTIRGTADEVALVARVLELNDKPRGEVLVEVEILEVERQKLRDYGLSLSQYQLNGTFNPLGTTLDSSGFTNVQPQVLSSLNVSDFVLSIPSTVFAKFMQNSSDVKLLASPKLRAGEGEKTSLSVITQVPVPTTTFQSTTTGGTTFTPVTSTVYKDVGVKMELTPKINPSGDISLKMKAEFSLQGTSVTINNTSFPEFLSRQVEGTLRVRDNERTLLGGLIQGREATTLAGVLGLSNIPILKDIFNSTQKEKDETEILISLTPHLVRAPRLTEADLETLPIGTAETVRVASAHPPLFAMPQPSPVPVAPAPPTSGNIPPPTGPETPPPAPSPAAASSVVLQFVPPLVSGRVGEVLTLNLSGQAVPGVTEVDLTLSYDPSAVEVLSISPGALLSIDKAEIGVERSVENGKAHAHFRRAQAGLGGQGFLAQVQVQGRQPGMARISVDGLTLTTAAGSESPRLPTPGVVELHQP